MEEDKMPRDMDPDEAALKIQQASRSRAARKKVAKKRAELAAVQEEEDAAVKIQSSFKGHKARKEVKKKKKMKKIHDEGEDYAASKIQAQYRGRRDRQKVQEKKEEINSATKIQANFRGHQSRKKKHGAHDDAGEDPYGDENIEAGEAVVSKGDDPYRDVDAHGRPKFTPKPLEAKDLNGIKRGDPVLRVEAAQYMAENGLRSLMEDLIMDLSLYQPADPCSWIQRRLQSGYDQDPGIGHRVNEPTVEYLLNHKIRQLTEKLLAELVVHQPLDVNKFISESVGRYARSGW